MATKKKATPKGDPPEQPATAPPPPPIDVSDKNFIAELVPDPAAPPALTCVSGYPGASVLPDHVRLYSSPNLQGHVDVPLSAVVARASHPHPLCAPGTDILWIKQGTPLTPSQSPTNPQAITMYPPPTLGFTCTYLNCPPQAAAPQLQPLPPTLATVCTQIGCQPPIHTVATACPVIGCQPPTHTAATLCTQVGCQHTVVACDTAAAAAPQGNVAITLLTQPAPCHIMSAATHCPTVPPVCMPTWQPHCGVLSAVTHCPTVAPLCPPTRPPGCPVLSAPTHCPTVAPMCPPESMICATNIACPPFSQVCQPQVAADAAAGAAAPQGLNPTLATICTQIGCNTVQPTLHTQIGCPVTHTAATLCTQTPVCHPITLQPPCGPGPVKTVPAICPPHISLPGCVITGTTIWPTTHWPTTTPVQHLDQGGAAAAPQAAQPTLVGPTGWFTCHPLLSAPPNCPSVAPNCTHLLSAPPNCPVAAPQGLPQTLATVCTQIGCAPSIAGHHCIQPTIKGVNCPTIHTLVGPQCPQPTLQTLVGPQCIPHPPITRFGPACDPFHTLVSPNCQLPTTATISLSLACQSLVCGAPHLTQHMQPAAGAAAAPQAAMPGMTVASMCGIVCPTNPVATCIPHTGIPFIC